MVGSGLGIGLGEELKQLGIVVEHFLEMRHEPLLVDRITGKSAADMIMDPACNNPIQGQEKGLPR